MAGTSQVYGHVRCICTVLANSTGGSTGKGVLLYFGTEGAFLSLINVGVVFRCLCSFPCFLVSAEGKWGGPSVLGVPGESDSCEYNESYNYNESYKFKKYGV